MKSTTIKGVFLFFSLIIFSSALFLLFVPYLAEKLIVPGVLKDISMTTKDIRFLRITPWKMEASISLGNDGLEIISVARLQVNYSPISILQRRVGNIIIDSAVLHLEMADETVVLRTLTPASEPSSTKALQLPVLPFTAEGVELKNSRIVLHQEGRAIQVIVDSSILPTFTSTEKGYQFESLSARLTARGDIHLDGEMRFEPNGGGYSLFAEGMVTEHDRIMSLYDGAEDTSIKGNLKFQASLSASGSPTISSYEAELELNDFSLQQQDLLLGTTGDAKIRLKLKGNMDQAELTLKGLHLLQPAPVAIAGDGIVDLGKKEFRGKAQLLPEKKLPAMALEYQGNFGESTDLQFTARGEKFSLDSRVDVAPFSLQGSINVSEGSAAADLEATIPEITSSEQNISLAGILVRLPIVFPLSSSGAQQGEFNVAKIRYTGEDVASLAGSLSMTPEKIDLQAKLSVSVVDDLVIICKSNFTRPSLLNLGCEVPKKKIDSARLPAWVDLPENLQFSGKLGGSLNYLIDSGEQRGDARITLAEVELRRNDNFLQNLSGTIVFPILPHLQSSPSQLFTIDEIRLGKILMTDGRIHLRVDDQDSAFIEKAKFNWSGGRIETGALRLYKGMKVVDATFYCDRLRYTDLLAQFGIGEAEGGGSLNGRLPVTISRETITFDNGFLFSTPGDSGIVKFTDTENLGSAMAGLEEMVYLDYSMDALENFSYDWTKLTFNSEEEELVLSLQLDGKPAKPLPYGYRMGQIVRTTEGEGIQHPIRLDVNFRLPMRDLFYYGTSIQSFMEKE